MSSDDDDKTVFGQSLPQRPNRQPPPAERPGQGGALPPEEGDRTVFGTPLPQAARPQGELPRAPQGYGQPPPQPYPSQPYPPQGQQPQPYPPQSPRVAQTGRPLQPPQKSLIQKPPSQQSNDEWGGDTWMDGPQVQPAPQPRQPYPQAQPRYAPESPDAQPQWRGETYKPETGYRAPGADMFPQYQRPEARPQPVQARKIPLHDALKATGIGAGGSSNPLISASANLMILLGRLRTGLVEMQSAPLLDHVAREIDLFERNALEAGVPPADVQDAKYAVCATADDIVQNLPGVDRGMWLEYAMAARFFNDRNAGLRFYERMDAAMKAPGQKFQLLELMLACLSLGFEGQYRATPNGLVQLTRIRTAIYETLRRVTPRPDDDISVRWTPVVFKGKRRRGGVPVWAVAAIGFSMAVTLFVTLSTLLSSNASPAVSRIALMHSGLLPLAMEPAAPVIRNDEPKSTQMDRLRAGLAEPIEAGAVALDVKKEWIAIRVDEALRFASGRAELDDAGLPLVNQIAQVLNEEQGPVRVIGHSDGDSCCKKGPFRSNEQLSEGRAQTVADLLAGLIARPDRLSVEGKGFTQPVVAPETSREDKSRNRRVEIMIQRED